MLVDGTRPDAQVPGDFLGLFVGRDAGQTGPLPRREGIVTDTCHGHGGLGAAVLSDASQQLMSRVLAIRSVPAGHPLATCCWLGLGMQCEGAMVNRA